MDVKLVDANNTSIEIAVLSLPVVPLKDDYIKLFGIYYIVRGRCLIVFSENGKPDEFVLSVEKYGN